MTCRITRGAMARRGPVGVRTVRIAAVMEEASGVNTSVKVKQAGMVTCPTGMF